MFSIDIVNSMTGERIYTSTNCKKQQTAYRTACNIAVDWFGSDSLPDCDIKIKPIKVVG